MTSNRYLAWGLLCLTALVLASPAVAAPITIPPGLNPGDQFRIIFVTSTKRNAASDSIGDYDAFVSAAAATSPGLAALGTNWTAIGSTAAVSAFDHIGGVFSAPVFNLGGLLVASNSADLWDGSLNNPVRFDESGADTNGLFEIPSLPGLSGAFVWTGTSEFGAAHFLRLGLKPPFTVTPADHVIFGRASQTNATWIFTNDFQLDDLLHVYGVSDVLTVPGSPVPEPGTFGTAALAAVVLAGGAIRSRRREG